MDNFLKFKTYIIFFIAVFTTGFISIAQNQIVPDDPKEASLEVVGSPIEKIELLLYLTDSLATKHPAQGLNYATEALKLSEEQNYDEGRLKAMNHIAAIYWEKTDLKSSLEIANKAKELALQINNQNEYAVTILLIGKIYSDLGDFKKSSELYFEALKISEREDNKFGILNALNKIGNIYFLQENYDKALEYWLKLLELANEFNDLESISKGLNNITAVYINNGDEIYRDEKGFEKLENYISESLEITKKLGYKIGEGSNYLNLAVLNHYVKKYDSAFINYQKANAIFTELNNVPLIAATCVNLATYYIDMDELEKSLFYANKAYKLSEENGLIKWMFMSAKVLHEIYLWQNDIEKAYEYISLQHNLKDSIDIEKNMMRLSQLESLYDFEKQIQEKQIKQKEKDFIIAIWITILIFISVVIIVILLAKQRIRRNNVIIMKKQFENEMEIKNKELTSNVMTMIRKNETISEIANKLKEINRGAVKDETKLAIKKVAIELQTTNDNDIWEEFEMRFKQVHHEFYTKLIQQFPNLTPNEQRLCAFLRLNMTTKEISELTGQRHATLDIARSRLRKKLNISNTKTNLVTFLTQI